MTEAAGSSVEMVLRRAAAAVPERAVDAAWDARGYCCLFRSSDLYRRRESAPAYLPARPRASSPASAWAATPQSSAAQTRVPFSTYRSIPRHYFPFTVGVTTAAGAAGLLAVHKRNRPAAMVYWHWPAISSPAKSGVGERVFERWHAGEPDSVRNLPVGFARRIVAHADNVAVLVLLPQSDGALGYMCAPKLDGLP